MMCLEPFPLLASLVLRSEAHLKSAWLGFEDREVFLKRLVLSLLFFSFCLPVGPASAAPPASCASKFVGSWTVRVEATGQTYPSLILPNGRTQVTCPMCTPGGSWTCAGDTITVNVD